MPPGEYDAVDVAHQGPGTDLAQYEAALGASRGGLSMVIAGNTESPSEDWSVYDSE